MMDVLLVMFKSDGARRDFPITKNRVVIGRKTDCDLRIPLSSVSRHHCQLTIDHAERQIVVRDLGSSNGTYHNNVRIQEAVLAAGDEIMVGPVIFTLVIDGEPEQIEPVRTVIHDDDSKANDAVSSNESEHSSPKLASHADVEVVPDDEEEDSHLPTVDLDDPIEALQRMADAEAGDTEDSGYFLADDDEQADRSA